jgi:hypothetical protein
VANRSVDHNFPCDHETLRNLPVWVRLPGLAVVIYST